MLVLVDQESRDVRLSGVRGSTSNFPEPIVIGGVVPEVGASREGIDGENGRKVLEGNEGISRLDG